MGSGIHQPNAASNALGPGATGTTPASPTDNSTLIPTTAWVNEFLAASLASGNFVLPTTGIPSNTVGQNGDYAVDYAAGNVYAKAGGTWSLTFQIAGATPFVPLTYQSVKWAFVSDGPGFAPLPAYTYANGASGVGATMTASANGALSIDSGTPGIGDRVVVSDPQHDSGSDGIYTVTAVGSGSAPWVLTRSADADTTATLCRYWTVAIIAGTNYAGGFAALRSIESTAPVIGTTSIGIDVRAENAGTIGAGHSGAIGPGATASGAYAYANGARATASGVYSLAAAADSTASARGAQSYANAATASAAYASASGVGSTAIGCHANAYAPGQVADVTDTGNNKAQRSAYCASGTTSNATPTLITSNPGPFAFNNWSKTVLVQGRIVARRTDVVGTDSAWTLQGVVRGNGSGAYTWVGGSAPSLTLVAQDSGASAWTATVTVDATTHSQLDITVTGAAGETIDWQATLELYELT